MRLRRAGRHLAALRWHPLLGRDTGYAVIIGLTADAAPLCLDSSRANLVPSPPLHDVTSQLKLCHPHSTDEIPTVLQSSGSIRG